MNGDQTPQPEEVVVTKSMMDEAYAVTQPTVDSSIQASTMAAIEVAALKAETDEETPLKNSANFEVVAAKDAKGDLVYLLRLLKHHGDDSKWVVCATDADLKDVISRRRQL